MVSAIAAHFYRTLFTYLCSLVCMEYCVCFLVVILLCVVFVVTCGVLIARFWVAHEPENVLVVFYSFFFDAVFLLMPLSFIECPELERQLAGVHILKTQRAHRIVRFNRAYTE